MPASRAQPEGEPDGHWAATKVDEQIARARSTGILAGLFGNDISGSRSPFLHQREADAQGLRLVYRLYDFAALGLGPADLGPMLRSAADMGFAGLNITYPFKQSVVALLDELTDNAARVGAVNTVIFAGGRMIGENTDSLGFAESLGRGLPGVTLSRVVQIGAGGAGAATADALLAAGTQELVLVEVDPERARALADNLRLSYPGRAIRIGEDAAFEIGLADGLVNATPIGMEGHPGAPVPAEAIHAGLWVADIVYFPLATALLRTARAIGCRTLDGSGMVVFQAAAAFDAFTGCEADRDRMLRSFAEFG
ncbi:shikimate dehydrogenase [Sphingosinicella terrae]|uniref:shikimate dehydrogenase n=1 Tax=Sphingosinicella terrae TaxID=2172047 RepID=UPI00254766C5|nr:shikimate dehydrogenase [Sphingosinicella terrae]